MELEYLERSNLDFNSEEISVEKRDGKPSKIVGLAAPFNSLSEPILDFREVIRPGAFRKTLRENKAQIKSLWNHDSNYVLGSVRAKTMALRETDRGLEVEIEPPPTQWAMDAMVSIDRGDVNQMSFGFDVVKQDWSRTQDGENLRTLIEVRLNEVSPVAFPAYRQTDVSLRNLLEGAGVETRNLAIALSRRQRGQMDSEDFRFITEAIDKLKTLELNSNENPATGGQFSESDSTGSAMVAMESKIKVLELAVPII